MVPYIDGLYRIVKYEGVRGLFKGTIMSIIGVSNGAIQFMAYEELKKQARRRRVKKYGQTDGPVDLVRRQCRITDTAHCSAFRYRAIRSMSLHLDWPKALRLQSHTHIRSSEQDFK